MYVCSAVHCLSAGIHQSYERIIYIYIRLRCIPWFKMLNAFTTKCDLRLCVVYIFASFAQGWQNIAYQYHEITKSKYYCMNGPFWCITKIFVTQNQRANKAIQEKNSKLYEPPIIIFNSSSFIISPLGLQCVNERLKTVHCLWAGWLCFSITITRRRHAIEMRVHTFHNRYARKLKSE